ncbi:MAG TPA: hypothetical protein VKS19_12220 [Verrucomicrobiae bacterium]|nr:hypothetical protein [Verrucomicrobiae bacterium]
MPDLPRQIRSAAGDYFMHGQDHRMRRFGLPGNVCCAIFQLDRGFDADRLRRRITESPIMDWLARARLIRPLPLLPPVWRTTTKPKAIFFEYHDQNGSGETAWSLPKAVAERELRAEQGPGVTFDVVRHADGTSRLYLSWNHTLLDARGLDFLLSHLNADGAANGAPGIQDFVSPRQTARSGGIAGWWSNAKMAHGSVKWLHESGKEPLFTLVPTEPRSGPCRNHRRLIRFTEAETARIDARSQQITAGFRRSHFYLAVSIRALHAIALRRGNRDGAYLVPVPHDTRRHGAKGPIFSNHLSILFYRIETRHAGRITDIVGELSRQMMDQIRDRFPECCMAALEMFKPLPLGYYAHHLGKPTRGKIASLSFSDSGEICPGITELCGGRILDATHLIPCWRWPGLTVLFLRFGNRLTAELSWVDDCLTPAEVDGLEQDVRKALLEEELS